MKCRLQFLAGSALFVLAVAALVVSTTDSGQAQADDGVQEPAIGQLLDDPEAVADADVVGRGIVVTDDGEQGWTLRQVNLAQSDAEGTCMDLESGEGVNSICFSEPPGLETDEQPKVLVVDNPGIEMAPLSGEPDGSGETTRGFSMSVAFQRITESVLPLELRSRGVTFEVGGEVVIEGERIAWGVAAPDGAHVDITR